MSFLLGTIVLSDTIRPKPEKTVLNWIEGQVPSDLFVTAQTIGELVRGARKVKEQAHRERFEKWIEQDLVRQFYGRILPYDDRTAVVWGCLMGDGDRVGRTPAAADAQIAAVAIQHNLILVTRNVRDFVNLDVQLLDPWCINRLDE